MRNVTTPRGKSSIGRPVDSIIGECIRLWALRDQIRKVDAAGIITTVAGNGAYGFSGDGEQATSASLDDPGRVAVDISGNLYIADSGNHRIRRVQA